MMLLCILILIKIDNILKKDMIKGICSYVLEFDLITFIVYFQENIQVCLEFSRFNTRYADIQNDRDRFLSILRMYLRHCVIRTENNVSGSFWGPEGAIFQN